MLFEAFLTSELNFKENYMEHGG